MFCSRCLQKLTLTKPGDLCSTLFTIDCYLPHLSTLVLKGAYWDPDQLQKWTEFGARTPNLKELSVLCYTRYHLPAYDAQPKLWQEHIPVPTSPTWSLSPSKGTSWNRFQSSECLTATKRVPSTGWRGSVSSTAVSRAHWWMRRSWLLWWTWLTNYLLTRKIGLSGVSLKVMFRSSVRIKEREMQLASQATIENCLVLFVCQMYFVNVVCRVCQVLFIVHASCDVIRYKIVT